MVNNFLLEYSKQKNWHYSQGVVTGEQNDYVLTLLQARNFKLIVIPLAGIKDEEKSEVLNFINEKFPVRLIQNRFDNSVLVIKTMEKNNPMSMSELDSIISGIIAFLRENNISTKRNCIICGKEDGDDSITIDGIKYYTHKSCYDREMAEINKQIEEYKTENKYYLKGFLGSLIGTLLAILPWVALSYFGYLAGILAYLIGVGAIKGYTLFKAKFGPKTRAIIQVSVIISVLIGHALNHIVKLISNKLPFSSEGLRMLYANPDLKDELVSNLFLSSVMAIIGIIQILRALRGPVAPNIKK